MNCMGHTSSLILFPQYYSAAWFMFIHFLEVDTLKPIGAIGQRPPTAADQELPGKNIRVAKTVLGVCGGTRDGNSLTYDCKKDKLAIPWPRFLLFIWGHIRLCLELTSGSVGIRDHM